MTPPVRSVVILAGGRSRRLGREKPFVEIAGRSVLERQLDAIAGCEDIVLSVRATTPFATWLADHGWDPGTGAPMDDRGEPDEAPGGRPGGARFRLDERSIRLIADPQPDLGPVAGVASALAVVAAPTAVVLAGDLPFVTADLVERLDMALADSPAADGVVPRVNGRHQPLCAAYRRPVADEAARYLARRTATRGPSMLGLLERLTIRTLGPGDLAGLGDMATATRGIDSPADLEWALGARADG